MTISHVAMCLAIPGVCALLMRAANGTSVFGAIPAPLREVALVGTYLWAVFGGVVIIASVGVAIVATARKPRRTSHAWVAWGCAFVNVASSVLVRQWFGSIK